MKFAKAEPARAYRSVVDQVCDAVMSGDLHVGDLLPPEREIALQTGVSRSSVREALRVLADAGLVVMKAGGGGGTRLINDMIPAELMGRAIEISHRRLLDLFEVRNSLELTAAELAAARADAPQIRQLEELVAQLEVLMRDYPTDRKAFRNIDLKFHMLVIRASGNHTLASTYNDFSRQVALAIEMVKLDEMEAHALPTMRSVVLAIKHRNPPEARLAMASHIYPLISIIEQFFDGRPLSPVQFWLDDGK